MPSPKPQWITVADLRGGRNGTDPPVTLREDECADAVNVDFYNCPFGRKRGGAEAIVTANATSNTTFAGVVSSLGRHVGTSDDTLAELWATDSGATPKIARLAAGLWSVPTLRDTPTGSGWNFSYASLNGKLFIAYKSAVDRLHCWDGLTVRRAGFPRPDTVTANNQGSGTYAATARYYRMRWTQQVGGITVRRSEASTALAITPSGSGASVRVTRSGLLSEGETHWELEVSLDGATFYLLATKTAATEYHDDSAATGTYSTGTVSASTGLYTPQKSYKFLAVDQNRLLGFGSWTAGNKQNRVEFTSVVGSLNVSDAERVPTDNYVDLDENDSGEPTGLVGPLNGSFFAFKTTQFWRLTPTGDAITPYAKAPISKTVGAVGPKAIVVGEDEAGAPAIYWMSDRGPYRWGQNGMEYIGYGIEDLLNGTTSRLNTGATISICHAVYYADKRQVWFFVSVDSQNEPEMVLVWNIGRVAGVGPSNKSVPSGWTRHTGELGKARCSVMFSDTIGATVGRRLKPYLGYAESVNKIWKADTTSETDAGTPFQAYFLSRAYVPWGLFRNGDINRSYVLAKTANGVSFSQSINADYGEQTAVSTVILTSTSTRTRKRFEDSGLSDIGTVQFVWGDVAPVASTWAIDAVSFEYLGKEVV